MIMNKRVNSYNFVLNGCVFYHAIASSEEEAMRLALDNGFVIDDLDIELERINVRDELGNPYKPNIVIALVE